MLAHALPHLSAQVFEKHLTGKDSQWRIAGNILPLFMLPKARQDEIRQQRKDYLLCVVALGIYDNDKGWMRFEVHDDVHRCGLAACNSSKRHFRKS